MNSIQVAPLFQQLMQLIVRHGMTALGALMVQWGLVDKATSDQIITILGGIVLASIGILWSYAEKKLNLQNLINAAIGAPSAVLSTTGATLAAPAIVPVQSQPSGQQ